MSPEVSAKSPIGMTVPAPELSSLLDTGPA
jgi:hypothetical protein